MADPADSSDSSKSGKSRRYFLRATGAATALGLAGCIQGQDGGDGGDGGGGDGGDGGDGSDGGSDGGDGGGDGGDGGGGDGGSDGGSTTPSIETLKVGVLNPVSGPFSPLGKGQRQGSKLAVDYVNNSDEFDFKLEAVYEDTQTDPSAGRQKAQKLVQEDDVDYIAGCINSSVALAVSDFCKQEGIVYTTGGAAMELTGANCHQYAFRNETHTAQQAAGLVDYAASELGSNWWIHTADYAYGNSAITEIENRIDNQGYDVSIVGKTTPSPGTSDFSPQISKISNSDADVLAIPLTGGPLINFMKQASNAGLKDEVDIIGTALFAQIIRGALGQAAYGTYSATLYNHKVEAGDNAQFVDAYMNQYDGPPGSFTRVGYEAVRMPARGAQEAGSSNPDDIASTLPGLKMTTVLGETAFRACDHQTPNPVWAGQVTAPDSGKVGRVELLDKIGAEKATPPCSDIDCSM